MNICIHALGTHCFHELNGSVSVYCSVFSLFMCSFNTSLTAFCFRSLAYVEHTRAVSNECEGNLAPPPGEKSEEKWNIILIKTKPNEKMFSVFVLNIQWNPSNSIFIGAKLMHCVPNANALDRRCWNSIWKYFDLSSLRCFRFGMRRMSNCTHLCSGR